MTDRLSSDDVPTYPPGEWAPRPPPRSEDIDDALEWARDWWWYGAFDPYVDDSLETFLDLFERYLAGSACRRHNRELANGAAPETEQATLGGGPA